MSDAPQLHSSIVAMVSLAAGIAAKHPDMGLCQLGRLRQMGVPQSQIDTVIEIARHIRDEAGEKLDASFNEKSASSPEGKRLNIGVTEESSACCNSTSSGQACC